MSYLADLLGKREASFNYVIKDHERRSGHKGVDVRLIGELHEKTAELLRELGLDVYDTTGKELYHALNGRFARDKSGEFWDKYLYVACMHDGAPVSANVHDVSRNLKLEYGDRQYSNFRRSLLRELESRYDKHRRVI